MAQNPAGPKTREQVKNELKEAIRTGNMPANDESGRMLNEVNPSAYPPKPTVPCKTREQVKAELAEAQRTGNMIAPGESGCLLNELNPSAYPPKPVVPCKTREEVKAELAEAQRTGKSLSFVHHSQAVREVLDLLNLVGELGDPLIIPLDATGSGR